MLHQVYIANSSMVDGYLVGPLGWNVLYLRIGTTGAWITVASEPVHERSR
jgi:hypothetical protein